MHYFDKGYFEKMSKDGKIYDEIFLLCKTDEQRKLLELMWGCTYKPLPYSYGVDKVIIKNWNGLDKVEHPDSFPGSDDGSHYMSGPK